MAALWPCQSIIWEDTQPRVIYMDIFCKNLQTNNKHDHFILYYCIVILWSYREIRVVVTVNGHPLYFIKAEYFYLILIVINKSK